MSIPLGFVPSQYIPATSSNAAADYLKTVLAYCPAGARSLQIGSRDGYGAIWLSLRGVESECILEDERDVVRARHAGSLLGGGARFQQLNPFHLASPELAGGLADRYAVIYHRDLLESYTAPQITALLAQQVARTDWVVFSVKSAYYSQEPAERETLMPIAEWKRLLRPFEIEELRYNGNICSESETGEHILCVLKGQACTDELRQLMSVPDKPYLPGISAVVQTRNEEQRLADCLSSLRGWTDEIIVCDMESSDATLEIAQQFTNEIIRHPPISNFDAARNVSAIRAKHEWVFYLDADELVSPELGASIRAMAMRDDVEFNALHFPFQHHFAGRWMRMLQPGYKAASLYRNGTFHYNSRLHAGARVEGKSALFPADDPSLAITHYSYESLSHYLDKLNHYTDGEALNMDRDNRSFHWQDAVAEFAKDLSEYYNVRQAGAQDGVHGFLYSFLSAFYRFEQHAKLYERRFRDGRVEAHECVLPARASDILACALSVAQQLERRQAAASGLPPVSDVRTGDGLERGPIDIVWTGPLESASGYGEESRHLLLALELAVAESTVAAQVLRWGDRKETAGSHAGGLSERKLASLMNTQVSQGFVQVLHTFGSHFSSLRHPLASYVVGRTIFETDRLPQDWVMACNEMDRVWVATEFNRRTFTESGVDPAKIAVIPECIDPRPYRCRQASPASLADLQDGLEAAKPYIFLSIFDWTLHKGWDVLLSAFIEEFCSGGEAGGDAVLLLKVWSSQGYTQADIHAQARSFVRERYSLDLDRQSCIRFIDSYLQPDEIIGLYQMSDCYVMPSRGEGWGRPYMEAMACGLPVIGTGWGGNTEFMRHGENSLLVDSHLVPVPESGWREVAYYKGHRWAEPDKAHLRQLMRFVHDKPDEAKNLGSRAAEYVEQELSHAKIGGLMADELRRIQAMEDSPPTPSARRHETPDEHSPEHLQESVVLPTPLSRQSVSQILMEDQNHVIA